jgi:arylsulfatase A-like enzyme
MKFALYFLAAALWIPAIASAEPDRPNIVIIFIDDLGYADIGPFGAKLQKTPHLDRMAQEGMKLTSFYAAPVCSVSRAALLTGCYGPRISVPGVYFPGQPNGLNPEETTIAEYLKQQGYATACIGKWHLGDQPEFLPTNQGFDRYFGIPYSNDMQRKAVGGTERVTPLLRDDKVAELLTDEQQSQIVERYTEEAVKFMREKKDEPFFLYFPHTAVHTPIYPGEAFRGKSQNGRFGDWVEEVDWSVGQVLEAIGDLELDEKTLVIFTSDNGPWLVKRQDGGSALPLRGGKGSTWEGGVRVPTIARWPGKIAANSTCDTVAATIDLLPTAVALAGGSVPAEPVIDGRDISSLLLGKTTEPTREAHYYFSGYTLQAVRQGPWKLALVPQNESMGQKASDDVKANPRLYNLDDDIGETTNVALSHPEIVERLQALADRIEKEIGGASPTARRPAGKVDQPQTLYPTENDPRRASPAASKRADLTKLKPGDCLASGASPQVGNRAFTVTMTFDTEQSDTVLLAHGGLIAGYALLLREGHVAFVVRHGGDAAFEEIASPRPISGKTKVQASLTKEGGMKLTINGEVVAQGKSESLIPRQPQEEFCLGHDSAMPVASNSPRLAFAGTITDLSVTTP